MGSRSTSPGRGARAVGGGAHHCGRQGRIALASTISNARPVPTPGASTVLRAPTDITQGGNRRRERGSRRRRITRGIPRINHDATRPAHPRMTSPNHTAIMASHAHTKFSPSPPSGGGGPGAPLRPAGRLAARLAQALTTRVLPRVATLGAPPLLCHPARRGERRGRIVDTFGRCVTCGIMCACGGSTRVCATIVSGT